MGDVIGDILHNLRSALDCLAWQLAITHLGREPTDKEAGIIYFPLADGPAKFAIRPVRKSSPPLTGRCCATYSPTNEGTRTSASSATSSGPLGQLTRLQAAATRSPGSGP